MTVVAPHRGRNHSALRAKGYQPCSHLSGIWSEATSVPSSRLMKLTWRVIGPLDPSRRTRSLLRVEPKPSTMPVRPPRSAPADLPTPRRVPGRDSSVANARVDVIGRILRMRKKFGQSAQDYQGNPSTQARIHQTMISLKRSLLWQLDHISKGAGASARKRADSPPNQRCPTSPSARAARRRDWPRCGC